MNILRAPEDGTGAAAPGAADPAAAGASASPGATAATTTADPAASPAAYRPDGLPDHLYGTNDKETVEKLFKAYGGARQAIADRGEVPKEAAGYTFEPSEAVKPYAAAFDADPFFGKVKEAALANGIPTKQFTGFLNAVMGEMIAGELVAEPFDADKERAALVPGETDPAKRDAAADRIVRESMARVNAWKEQGMPQDVAASLLSGLDRATTNRLVAWIAGERQEAAPVLTGGTPGSQVATADLDARLRDPRNSINSPKYDKAYAVETTEMFKRAYPGEVRA